MNIEQVKRDLNAGIQVSKPTLLKLAKAALMYEAFLEEQSLFSEEHWSTAKAMLDEVDKL